MDYSIKPTLRSYSVCISLFNGADHNHALVYAIELSAGTAFELPIQLVQ